MEVSKVFLVLHFLVMYEIFLIHVNGSRSYLHIDRPSSRCCVDTTVLSTGRIPLSMVMLLLS